jgi:hypothetical protein
MAERTEGSRLAVFDVRPILATGEHPLSEVLARLEALAPTGVLEVVAPFEPRPLVRLLRERGMHVEALAPPGAEAAGDASGESCADAHACAPPRVSADAPTWVLRISPSPLPPLEELTQLEAPLPLERVLEACAALPAGRVYMAHLPRQPQLLVPHLERRGLEWHSAPRPDGTVVLWVRSRA